MESRRLAVYRHHGKHQQSLVPKQVHETLIKTPVGRALKQTWEACSSPSSDVLIEELRQHGACKVGVTLMHDVQSSELGNARGVTSQAPLRKQALDSGPVEEVDPWTSCRMQEQHCERVRGTAFPQCQL